MVGKIFEILLGVKKATNITKAGSVEMVDKIVNEITSGNINPVEGYVMLDYIQKVTSEAMANVKPLTMDHIQREGDDTAFGVKLTLVARKSYSYEEDKMWADQEKKMKTYKDAMVAREKFLQNLVKEAIEAGEEPVISYTTSISITPKPISS
jgi:hypothetical protein